MRTIVIDASVAVKWFVREANTDGAVHLLEDEETLFVAPDIFRAEVVNALLRQHREGALTDDLPDLALIELEAAMPHLVSSGQLMDRAVAIARRIRHPIYDCLYLALAERWETVLVTADDKFVDLCRRRLTNDHVVERLRALPEHRPT